MVIAPLVGGNVLSGAFISSLQHDASPIASAARNEPPLKPLK